MCDEETDFLPFDPFGGAYTVCACCGAEVPGSAQWTQACHMCGWVRDDEAEQEPEVESEANSGFTLTQAQINFGALGWCIPPYMREP